MTKPCSSIVCGVNESSTVAISDRARQLQQEGIDVVNLGGGDPDFATPLHIQTAGIQAIRNGLTHYVNSKGIPEIRKAIAGKIRCDHGLAYQPDHEIIATASGKIALYIALGAVIEPGDQVLILEPAWVSYRPIIQLLGGIPVAVPLKHDNHYFVTEEIIEAFITHKTKAIIINSPNNPTGRVLTEAELNHIARVSGKFDLWVLTDEIYDKIIYDDKKHRTIATLPNMQERTLIINGMSKTYAMTGWRLGYVAGPAAVMEQILKIQQHLITCAASFTQVAGVAALEGGYDCVNQMVAEYSRRRREVTAYLNEIPGIQCPLPEGAFYLFPKVGYKGMNSVELAHYLLNDAHVAVTPGIAFGEAGEGHIRLTFATSMQNLRKAVNRIKRALQ